MKLSFVVSLLVAASFAAYAQQAMPRMISVDPPNGKKGDVIAVTGENLQKALVSKVYLTDGKNDTHRGSHRTDGHRHQVQDPGQGRGRPSGAHDPDHRQGCRSIIEQPVKLTVDPD